MSGTHKYPTISFRISPREREEIEAKIFVSGIKIILSAPVFTIVYAWWGRKKRCIRLWKNYRKCRAVWKNWQGR